MVFLTSAHPLKPSSMYKMLVVFWHQRSLADLRVTVRCRLYDEEVVDIVIYVIYVSQYIIIIYISDSGKLRGGNNARCWAQPTVGLCLPVGCASKTAYELISCEKIWQCAQSGDFYDAYGVRRYRAWSSCRYMQGVDQWPGRSLSASVAQRRRVTSSRRRSGSFHWFLHRDDLVLLGGVA